VALAALGYRQAPELDSIFTVPAQRAVRRLPKNPVVSSPLSPCALSAESAEIPKDEGDGEVARLVAGKLITQVAISRLP
jgi:hypothetical protein